MSGRLLFCLVLTVTCGLLPGAASAQSLPWSRGSRYHKTLEAPLSAAAGPGNAVAGTSYPHWGQPPYGGGAMWANDYVDGNTYAFGNPGHYGYPDYNQLPGVGAPPYASGVAENTYRPAPVGHPYGHPENGLTTYEMLPRDRGLLYDEDVMLLRSLGSAMRGSYVRMEYLSWAMENPGNTLLGARMASTDNPREDFVVVGLDEFDNLVPVGTARVLDMSPVDLWNLQGARVSFGLPFSDGQFAANFWGIEQVTRFGASEFNSIRKPGEPGFPTNPNAVFVATSLLDNGTVSDLLILYDRKFEVKYNIKHWAADANLFYDLRSPVDGWTFQGMVGLRYQSHKEDLIQRGSFDNRSELDPNAGIIGPDNNEIGSFVENHRYGLQLGLKSEWDTKYLTFGVIPKVALGANHTEAEVTTHGLRSSSLDPVHDDPSTRSVIKDTKFAPTFDVGVYARWKVTPSLSLQVGYDYSWLGNIIRADDSIRYNDTGLANPPAITAKQSNEDLWMHGISIGGQLTLP